MASVSVPARAGEGHGATEAPRGLLYHRYRIDDAGTILAAQITPPTSQNQSAIEADLRAFVQANLHLSHAELTHQCEIAIRTYDPCISCATHFLDLEVEHRMTQTAAPSMRQRRALVVGLGSIDRGDDAIGSMVAAVSTMP